MRRLRERIHLIPRYTMRLDSAPLGLANPVWVDDDGFDPARHVRRAALPAPGGDAELCELVGHVMSERLDRSRPLWQLLVVEGLEARTERDRRPHAPRARGRHRRRRREHRDPRPDARRPRPAATARGGAERAPPRPPGRAARPARGRAAPDAAQARPRRHVAGARVRPARGNSAGARLGLGAARAGPCPPHRAGHAAQCRDRRRALVRAGARTTRRHQGRAPRRRRNSQRRPARHGGAGARGLVRRGRAREGRRAGPGLGASRLRAWRARQPHLDRLRRPAPARRAARPRAPDLGGDGVGQAVGTGSRRSADRGRDRPGPADRLLSGRAGDERAAPVQPGGVERARPAADLLPRWRPAAGGVPGGAAQPAQPGAVGGHPQLRRPRGLRAAGGPRRAAGRRRTQRRLSRGRWTGWWPPRAADLCGWRESNPHGLSPTRT